MDSENSVKPSAQPTKNQSVMEGEGTFLHESVHTLSRMIKDLEKQLGRMLEVNDALEQDLDKERKKFSKNEQERKSLADRLERAEHEIESLEDLHAEIGHLGQERSRLSLAIEELGRQLSEAQQENKKIEHLSERMLNERDDAIEELQSVEAQFDHAMEIVSDLKTRVTTLAEERDALVGRLKVLEGQLQITEQERDALKTEVDESRKALDEIRRSVADACVLSKRWYHQPEEMDEGSDPR